MLFKDILLERLTQPLTDYKFNCGNEDLNEFLIKDSHSYQKQLLAVTYVFKKKKSLCIAAYFSVLNDAIEADNRSNRSIPNAKRHRKIPAVKIGRLAVDVKYQKVGMGSDILDFVKYFFVNNNKTGCRFLLADAYNDPTVLKFYQKNGFEFLSDTDRDQETSKMEYDRVEK